MQASIRHFVQLCVDHLPVRTPVYEFGAYQVSGSEVENLRPLFPGAEYIGADMREGPGVDCILNLHDLELDSGIVGTALCLDTLEHVEYPRKAMSELFRVLEPGGMVVISSVFDFPIHDYPNDFWRFTPEGFRSLLSGFAVSAVFSYGKSEVSPQVVVGVGFKEQAPNMDEFLKAAEHWSKWYSGIARKLSAEGSTG
ncbi:methyltransferase domain-containing protein [Parahaliea aestuarii]|uniref:Class I SAM-dependent methyltransferase n=1 Tax=Parahaliea aestuarii TaxID=1852021 RepID=A0A5C8ZR01_9GAMM|nr:methyltransferase domain-containing protein [Parahaliea aestuarii]TXS90052.1 class I SAM-dependent methyltransferase [Parahaliea aestuarii]